MIKDLQIIAFWKQKPNLVYMHSVKDKYAKAKKEKTTARHVSSLKKKLKKV